MTASEKEVAFRKRRRDYTINKLKNPIQAGTTIIRLREPRFFRPESILATTRAVKADKRKFDINSKRPESVNFPQPPITVKVALVIRLVQKKDPLSVRSRGVLEELRLINQFDGVFVSMTEEIRQKLRCISHLIAYGLPSLEVIRQLVHTKASTMMDGKEVLITGNKCIQDALGEFDVEGLSDIVHVLNSGGVGLAEVCTFLAPFHFNPKKIQNAKRPIYAGGPAGWRANDMNTFIESIL
jgi:large subunit ribosomal protein L7e